MHHLISSDRIFNSAHQWQNVQKAEYQVKQNPIILLNHYRGCIYLSLEGVLKEKWNLLG